MPEAGGNARIRADTVGEDTQVGIVGAGPNGWLPVAFLTAGAATVAGICALTARETAHVPLADLGTPAARQTEREAQRV